MAAAHGHRRLRWRNEPDLISALPDELLLHILHHLGSTPAAARTAVLSGRWRRLWSDLPELRLDSVLAPLPGVGTVDGALAACSVRTLTRLRISLDHLSPWGGDVSAARVTSWLRFASARVAGDLCSSCRLQHCRARRISSSRPSRGSRRSRWASGIASGSGSRPPARSRR
ncbi:hypothetical protein ACP70R_004508 [Stipagrostis hirtigluma subsp. patula]